MFRSSHRILTLGVAVAFSFTIAGVAAAQGNAPPVINMHRLGGTTAFVKPPLKTVTDLRDMSNKPALASDLRALLAQAGVSALADDVMRVMSTATTSVRGGECIDAMPVDGIIVECDVQRGRTLEWMAYRPRGGTTIGLLRNVRWDGAQPFSAYLFRITKDNHIYTFMVPKLCGNIALMDVKDVPRAAVVVVPPPAPAPPPPPPPAAVIAPPPPPMAIAEVIQPAPIATKSSPFFVDALFGKERRERPIGNTEFLAGQCTPLFGAKVGLRKRFSNNWELASAVGIAVALVDGDEKIKENELFVDIEANKYLNNGMFLGAGVSFWDVTRSDTFTPAVLVHAGVPLNKDSRIPLFFLVEGRVLLDHADSIDNNYQFWGGLRIHFGR